MKSFSPLQMSGILKETRLCEQGIHFREEILEYQ